MDITRVTAARRQQLKGLLETRFEYKVDELITSPYDPSQNLNYSVLERIRRRKYDLLVAHTGGNPQGSVCLKVFKDHNPKGKVILYTKRDNIELKEFDDLKRANKLFQRSDNDSLLFDNESEMMDVIEAVMNEPGLVLWKSPFEDKKVLTVLTALLTFFEFKIQNAKFKMKDWFFEFNNFGYKPPPQSLIWWSSISGEFKLPLIAILN